MNDRVIIKPIINNVRHFMRSISGISYPNRSILKIDILENDIVDSSSLSKTYRRSIFGGELEGNLMIPLLYISLENQMGIKILL